MVIWYLVWNNPLKTSMSLSLCICQTSLWDSSLEEREKYLLFGFFSFYLQKNLHPVANSSNKETNSTDFLTWSWHISIIFGWQTNISQTSPQSTEFRHLSRRLQEGFAWNMRGWGMNLKKRTFFFTGSMGTYMNLPDTSSTSRYCIPFIDSICFFDILLGKWYILRWIRQVPKTTRMYCFFFNLECPWVCWFGAWKMFQTYAPKWWSLSSWWFQPTWKILVKIEIFPK